MRQHLTRTPGRGLARGFLGACALALIGVALVGIVEVEAARRTARSEAVRMQEYSALSELAAMQRVRLGAEGARAVRDKPFTAAASRATDLLGRLQGQTVDPEAGSLMSLEVSYSAALREARSGGGARAVSVLLPRLQANAAHGIRQLEARQRSTLDGSPIEGLGLAAAAVLAAATLVWLLRRGLLSPRRPVVWDGREQRVQELQVQALTDSLTKLGNHRAFHAALSAELKRRAATGAHFTLMAVDLDGLKHINDSRGHPAGDAHIKAITQSLETVIGRDGTIYRTGGDEFMVILPNKRNWDALLLASKIDLATRQLTGARAVSVGLTESTGLEGRQLLVHQADVALYEAKRTKLRAVSYHPGLARPLLQGSPGSGPSREQRALAAALARAVDAKDPTGRSHSELVAELSVAIGSQLGFGGDRLERLRLAGLLHDVGKIGVDDAILQKPKALGEEEWRAVADHVKIGHAILVAAELPAEAEWILHHHERTDGAGYPAGRSGEEIPLESRVISAAAAFEAMTGPRPYRESMSTDDALAELRRSAGSQFDERCVEALAAVVQNAPTKDMLPLPVVLEPHLVGTFAQQAS